MKCRTSVSGEGPLENVNSIGRSYFDPYFLSPGIWRSFVVTKNRQIFSTCFKSLCFSYVESAAVRRGLNFVTKMEARRAAAGQNVS